MTLKPGTIVDTPFNGALLLLEPYESAGKAMWHCYSFDKRYVFDDYEIWITSFCRVVK